MRDGIEVEKCEEYIISWAGIIVFMYPYMHLVNRRTKFSH